MEQPHVPLGLLAKIFLWLKDLGAMPGRVRSLAEGLEADRDKRPICRSCGVGRVGQLQMVTEPGWMGSAPIGTCAGCGLRWFVDSHAGSLKEPYA